MFCDCWCYLAFPYDEMLVFSSRRDVGLQSVIKVFPDHIYCCFFLDYVEVAINCHLAFFSWLNISQYSVSIQCCFFYGGQKAAVLISL